ncbi:hypothetical protein TcG_12082 [Trypanosoma cruzi]|uniref:Uncharacterized protein n=1 Tax=Trypanosoma cruzi Dm28c TaxID=1416333 RepID=V5CIE4_TRYCR|nr:hypothetical protein TCDM_13427 [Trypanosoma cruzi Dm28c]RNE99751.1 hypothetical protein TcG_12082 [Trypanosoma cruzi]
MTPASSWAFRFFGHAMNRHHRTDSLSTTAGPPSDRPFQGFTNNTCLFHKQRMLYGDPQIHFVPIARRGDGPQHSALPQIFAHSRMPLGSSAIGSTSGSKSAHVHSSPGQAIPLLLLPLRNPTAMGAPNNAVALRKDGRVPSFPGASFAHSTVARCANSFPPTVSTARRVGEVAHGTTTSAALRRTHAERPHPYIDDDVPPVPAQKSLLPEPKSFLFVFIGLLAQLHSARRVVLSSPTTFAASCFIGRRCGMLFLCSLKCLEEWAVPFLGTSIAR